MPTSAHRHTSPRPRWWNRDAVADLQMPEALYLGRAERIGNIHMSVDVRAFTETRIRYPEPVVAALTSLFVEYQHAFKPLVEANREWPTDYRFCSPLNCAVQIDMVGLTQRFLAAASDASTDVLEPAMRQAIFEIENSLAMYQLLERTFRRDPHESFFRQRYRQVLQSIRQRHGMKIALLAVTDEKYRAMRQTEFGKSDGEPLSRNEVFDMSGFDRLFGPEEFLQHISKGSCDYLLYVRSSDPIEKLKDARKSVAHPLLSDERVRRLIKEHAITLNIDAPDMPFSQRINDTKGYMHRMGLGYPIRSDTDLDGHEFNGYMQSCGFDEDDVRKQLIAIRAKPLKGAYGCYGHLRGLPTGRLRADLRRELKRRGDYVIQPELNCPTIRNESDGRLYTIIDRNFFGDVEGKPMFLGGFRAYMPVESVEAKRGRNHGNADVVWGEIVA